MVAASSSLLSMAGLTLIDFSISIIWSSQARLHQRQAMWLVRSEMELLVFARWLRDMLAIFIFPRLHIRIWGNSNPRIEQTASAVYAHSKDKDCVAILVASHINDFKLFSGCCGSGKSATFVLQVCPHKAYAILSESLSQEEDSFDVWHTRYEGNRNMNNMVEEQPEYPETDSPVIFVTAHIQ